jgi:hypothetical protein
MDGGTDGMGTYRNTPNRSTSRHAAADSGTTTCGFPIPMSMSFPPARAACKGERSPSVLIFGLGGLICRGSGTRGRRGPGGG